MRRLFKPDVSIVALVLGGTAFTYLAVWLHHAELIFGANFQSTAIVLGVFAGGSVVGTGVCARLMEKRPEWAGLALAISQIALGLYALAEIVFLGAAERLYVRVYPAESVHTLPIAFLQIAFGCLMALAPGILSGAAVPLLANRFAAVSASNRASTTFGWCMMGAAAAAAALELGLLARFGFNLAMLAAGTASVFLGVALLAIGRRTAKTLASAGVAGPPALWTLGGTPASAGVSLAVLISFACLWLSSVAFFIVSARALAMIMGPTVYTRDTLAVVIMAGLGFGALLYGVFASSAASDRNRLAALELAAAFSMALGLVILPRVPYLFVRFFPLFRNEFSRQLLAQLAAAIFSALGPAVLLGAASSAAFGALRAFQQNAGALAGLLYAASAAGFLSAILLAQPLLLPRFGLRGTVAVAVIVAICAGSVLCLGLGWPRPRLMQAGLVSSAALLVLTTAPGWKAEVFATGVGPFLSRYVNNDPLDDIIARTHLLYYRDGASATLSVDESGLSLSLRVNGNQIGFSDSEDAAKHLLLAHLPMLLHAHPRAVLVTDLNTGAAAAAISRYPVAWIGILQPQREESEAARLFDSYNHKILDDPRVRLLNGDSRAYLLTAKGKYDVIISEPGDLWVSGKHSQGTIEYYRMVAAHLNPGGIFAQQIAARALMPDELALWVRTFHAVFSHMQIWTPAPGNLILIGARDPVSWDYSRLKQQFSENGAVAEDLKTTGIWHPFALFGAQILDESGCDTFAGSSGEFLSDDRPAIAFRLPRYLYFETIPIVMAQLSRFEHPDLPAVAGFDPKRDFDADTSFLLGSAYASAGRTDLAITYMKRSTLMAPDRAVFFVGLGNEERAANRLSEAREAYEEALKRDLNNVDALIALGEIHLDQGELEWTRVLANRALRLAPLDARVHELVGRLKEAER